jgi:predicted Zn-dependent protease
MNKAFPYSIKAIIELLKNEINPSRKSGLQFSLARNYYYYGVWLAVQGMDQDSQNAVADAIKILEELSATENRLIEKWKAIELKAEIFHLYFYDLDQSLNLYQSLLNAPAGAAEPDRIYYQMGQILLEKNQLQDALMNYQKVIGKNYRQLAKYRCAEIKYYHGQFTKAEREFSDLILKTSVQDSLMNDLLSRVTFIGLHKKDSLKLAQFAEAELLAVQNKKSEAAEKYIMLVIHNNPLSRYAAEQAAELLMELDKPDLALSILGSVLEKDPLSPGMDYMYFLEGEIQLKLNNHEKAITAYRMILENYPESFYTDKAREKARLAAESMEDIQ